MLLVNKALLVVLPMCLALLQPGDTLSFVFNSFCSIGIKRWETLFTHYYIISLNIFNIFTMEQITLQTIIKALQCIVNAFKMQFSLSPVFPNRVTNNDEVNLHD